MEWAEQLTDPTIHPHLDFNMNVYAIGASRNIGYYTSVRLLAQGARVTFLLRSTSGLEGDEAIRPYITSGHAKLVKGDALIAADVAKGWSIAQEDGARPVDLVLFTLGGSPHFSLTKGLYLTPPNLVTQSLLNVFSTYPASSSPIPKLIVITSIGLTPRTHSELPLLLKPFYSLMLPAPHADKLGAERLVAQAAGKPWPSSDPEPKKGIMPEDWQAGVAKSGQSWTDTVIIRPAMLTDGACKADTAPAEKLPYRFSEQIVGSGYTISRRDVAHFIAEVLLKDWAKWQGKALNMAY